VFVAVARYVAGELFPYEADSLLKEAGLRRRRKNRDIL
jgi:hypothetical protein